MFSYLRPHHRRTPSNPTSPAVDHSQSPEPPFYSDHTHPYRPPDNSAPEPSSKASPPPTLPPIARVSSPETNAEASRFRTFEGGARLQYAEASRDHGRPQDTYTVSNNQKMTYTGAQRPDLTGNVAPAPQYTRQQSWTSYDSSKQKQTEQPFPRTSEAQNKPLPTGRRSNGARLPSPPPSNNYPVYEPSQPRSSKTRLNLLNPMSLLARRRTSQAIPQLSSESLVSNRNGNWNGNSFNETFDPRIRGTVVHDFSAPRQPRRNVSYNDARVDENATIQPLQTQRSPNPGADNDDNATSPWGGGNHTPVFTENFEEEQYPAAGPHVRKASDLTDLPLPQPPYAKGAQKPIEPTPPLKLNEPPKKVPIERQKSSQMLAPPDRPPPVPPKSEKRLSGLLYHIEIEPPLVPPKPASVNKGRARNISLSSIKDGAIPKHMKSTSSRFSFDMIGAAEQERLLEDRHRQRALEKNAQPADEEELVDDEFDDYDYDNMDDDDGLEERIPGINADLDEEDFYGDVDLEEPIPGVNADELEQPKPIDTIDRTLGGFTFHESNTVSPLSPMSPGMVSTPRDVNGEVIGFAMTKNSPLFPEINAADPIVSPVSSASAETTEGYSNALINGLGLQGLETQLSVVQDNQLSPVSEEDRLQSINLDDDDMYFDDGMITGLDDNEMPTEFDESVFDNNDTDEYGRPLVSLATLPTLYSPPMLTSQPSHPLTNDTAKPDDEKEASDGVSALPFSGGLAPQSSVLGHNIQDIIAPQASHGLTQDSLAAYQSALAAAAFSAAASGKFRRDSVATNPNPSDDEAQPGLVTDSSQTSHYEPFSPTYELDDDFDYDDLLEDDAIIAAANAEALANDQDGFYGQEFGFYSAPGGAEAEFVNGGYFGPRGIEGINRNPSGRIVSREPNLTPITERSEYSNRNSFMSLSAMHGPSSLASPGLAQLAGMLRSPSYDGDMSLDALLKLRRGAWGGSQVSLHSSNGSPKSAGGLEESSPVGAAAPWSQNGFVTSPVANGGSGSGHWRKNSGFSIVSEGASGITTGVQSEASSAPASPTLTVNVSPIFNNDSATKKDNQVLPEKKFKKKHRATGSAESISYSKEGDPVAGERWVLERRRTAESGEVELLGREVVKGGRI